MACGIEVAGQWYRLVGGTWEAEVGMSREMPKVTNKSETYRSPLLWRIDTTLKQRGGYDERSKTICDSQTPRLWLCTKSWVWRVVWGETFTHGSVRGWGWNSLALLDLWPKIQVPNCLPIQASGCIIRGTKDGRGWGDREDNSKVIWLLALLMQIFKALFQACPPEWNKRWRQACRAGCAVRDTEFLPIFFYHRHQVVEHQASAQCCFWGDMTVIFLLLLCTEHCCEAILLIKRHCFWCIICVNNHKSASSLV